MSHPDFPVEIDADAFEFGVPGGTVRVPTTPSHVEPPEALPLPPVAPARDPLEEGNRARERAGQSLSQLSWTFPDGTRRHPVLTSSRWALYEAVRATLVPTPATENYTQALSLAVSQRFLTATLLLWFCLHDAEVWESARPGDLALVNDWPALLRAARRWADDVIPPARLDDAVALAETLAELTFSAMPVRRPDPDDDSLADDGTQKKMPPLAGRTDTSPSSAATLE